MVEGYNGLLTATVFLPAVGAVVLLLLVKGDRNVRNFAVLVFSRASTPGDTNSATSPPKVAISRTKVLEMNWYLSLGVRNTVSTSGISERFMPASWNS